MARSSRSVDGWIEVEGGGVSCRLLDCGGVGLGDV
jgi:hypothetical protein